MADIESSIIIPVYNKWELTRNCLKSLAATLPPGRAEVIVVDNASSDVTPQAAQFLGKQLFGENFSYLRNEQNRNFAGACNQGADAARGNFLIFLNNDTVAEPGWYEPLIADFSLYPDIAGTGPLLVYPDAGPWGRPVQHLGVLVSPFLKFGHLYNGVPEKSALARKRRFFQVITGACLVMQKSVFFDIGKFDEAYINGFEDVDLCAKLVGHGYRFTVNPNSVIIHHESQTRGGVINENHNFQRLMENSLRLFHPDWQAHLEADGFALDITNWLRFQPRVSPVNLKKINNKLSKLSHDELESMVSETVYWQEGWEMLLNIKQRSSEYIKYIELYFNLFPTIPNAAKAMQLGRKIGSPALVQSGAAFLKSSHRSPEDLFEDATAAKDWCKNLGLNDLERKYGAWIENYANFKANIYPKYESEYFSLTL